MTLYEAYSIDEVTEMKIPWFRSESQQEVKDWIEDRSKSSPHNFYWRKELKKKRKK